MQRLRIGTRGSDLALWQAHHIAARLGGDLDIVIIKTAGDQIQHLSLDKVEGKGFFTKEIEAAQLDESVDIAVHSYKDLPIEAPAGLEIGAVPERAPVRDVLVVGPRAVDPEQRWGLKRGARVGTSSLRRKAQLIAQRQDLELVDLRGNVPTRVNKAVDGTFDAVLLAEAGLVRLGLFDEAQRRGAKMVPLAFDELCPAPAQGALAVQVRSRDERAKAAVRALHDPFTAQAVDVERRLLARFGGGCHLPLGAHCVIEGDQISLRALVAAPDGHECLISVCRGEDADEVVARVHGELVAAGADRYIAAP